MDIKLEKKKKNECYGLWEEKSHKSLANVKHIV